MDSLNYLFVPNRHGPPPRGGGPAERPLLPGPAPPVAAVTRRTSSCGQASVASSRGLTPEGLEVVGGARP